MSICVCEQCDRYIDSDFDADCFVEVGNMKRLHREIVLCEPCRDKFFNELEDEQERQSAEQLNG